MVANLLFNDEFNNFDAYSKADAWHTSYHWGANAPINGEKAYYVDTENDGTTGPAGGVNPFTAADGNLTISAAPATSALPTGQPYTSGVISTMGTFEHQYGYYEMRAQLSHGDGFWPAFWLMPADKVSPPELDIMEYSSRLPNEFATTAHSMAGGTYAMHQQFNKDLPNLSQGFHTYAVDWQADKITWFLDHQAIYSIDTPGDFHKPMYVLLNHAAGGGSWIGDPDGSIEHFKIDHVRVYDRNPDTDGSAAAQAPADQAEVYHHLVATQAPAAPVADAAVSHPVDLPHAANDAAIHAADMDLSHLSWAA